MADKKISQLTAATTPLAGTEVLPIVQSSTTVKATANDVTNRAIGPTSVAIGTALDGTLQSIGLAGATDGTTYGLNKWTPSTAEPTTYDLKLNTRFAGAGATGGWQYDFITRDFYTGSKTYLRFLGGNTVLPDGNLVIGTAGKGIDFSANTHAAGMTSELLNDYEEGTWTPNQGGGLTVVGAFSSTGRYTRVGNQVTISGTLSGASSIAIASPGIIFTNIPYTVAGASCGSMNSSSLNASGAITAISGTTVYGNTCPAVSTIYFAMTYLV